MSGLGGDGELVASHKTSVVNRAESIDPPSFRSVLATARHPRTVWSQPDSPTIVGSGAAAVLRADGEGRFEAIREQANALFAGETTRGIARPRLFGGFAFHDEHTASPPWDGFPPARFVLPEIQITWHEGQAWLSVNALEASSRSVRSRSDVSPRELDSRFNEAERWIESISESSVGVPPGIRMRERTTDRTEWTGAVEAATDRIASGELRKVVLAQALRTQLGTELSVPDTLVRLRERYPDCRSFLVEAPDSCFLGATPEQLLSLRDRTVETGALAGTIGRGETTAEDDWLAGELRSSEKDNHEHDLVVETIREQLEPLSKSITAQERRIRKLATVQHLETPISAELVGDEHVLSLVEALHPTPAVGGLPPDLALATIRETEPFERGWYAAPVGWFDADGNGTFGVALRSAVTTRETATLFAGVGIVGSSDPDREWDELQLKYRPILDALE